MGQTQRQPLELKKVTNRPGLKEKSSLGFLNIRTSSFCASNVQVLLRCSIKKMLRVQGVSLGKDRKYIGELHPRPLSIKGGKNTGGFGTAMQEFGLYEKSSYWGHFVPRRRKKS